jgi:hypothetical protein
MRQPGAIPPQRKPWPMKWIALAIVIFIAGYTYVRLHFAKRGPGFEPYRDIKERQVLQKAGYQRYPVDVVRPADPRAASPGAGVSAAPGGLPADLLAHLPAAPRLATAIGGVEAAGSVDRLAEYRVQFACIQKDPRQQVAGAELYLKGGEVLLAPEFEPLSGPLVSRVREATLVLTIPPGTLPAGRFRVTLVGQESSKAWSLLVH